jgi:hypothetical protein
MAQRGSNKARGSTQCGSASADAGLQSTVAAPAASTSAPSSASAAAPASNGAAAAGGGSRTIVELKAERQRAFVALAEAEQRLRDEMQREAAATGVGAAAGEGQSGSGGGSSSTAELDNFGYIRQFSGEPYDFGKAMGVGVVRGSPAAGLPFPHWEKAMGGGFRNPPPRDRSLSHTDLRRSPQGLWWMDLK